MKHTKGFTLIELVVVIVILGILAATALPKFVDLSGEAGDAAAKATAGAVSSAASINYAKRLASGGASGSAITTATTCADLNALMTGGALSSDTNLKWVSAAATLSSCGTAGNVDSTHCKVYHTNGATAAGFAISAVCTG